MINNANQNKTDETISNTASVTLEHKIQALSAQETREILTPFAFKIDQSLFGVALAVPWRRGAALLIDLSLVAILSGAPGELLAILVAITLFQLGSKKRAAKFGKKRGLRKTLLRFTGAFIVFVVLLDTLPRMFSQMNEFNKQVEQAGQQYSPPEIAAFDTGINDEQGLTKSMLSVAATIAIAQSECHEYSCWKKLTTGLLLTYIEQSPSAQQIEQFITLLVTNVIEQKSLSRVDAEKLNNDLTQQYNIDKNKEKSQTPVTSTETISFVEDVFEQNPDDLAAGLIKEAREINNEDDTGNDRSNKDAVYKGFAWLQGLIEDLGIGFGWAAFYFTMFTAIWHGQTPGKKLFSIRVIQLDGTPLSIWDSFGRYGGYGAGIATGLLGFAQIYWDPNRQAMHDKISATIVVKDPRSNE